MKRALLSVLENGVSISVALFAALLLSGCGMFSKKADDKNPLCKSECPAELPALTKDTFGDADLKLIEWAGIYHRCREACQAGTKEK
jgi:hypothetical protein